MLAVLWFKIDYLILIAVANYVILNSWRLIISTVHCVCCVHACVCMCVIGRVCI